MYIIYVNNTIPLVLAVHKITRLFGLPMVRIADFLWGMNNKRLLNSAFTRYQNYSDLGERYN